MEDTTPLRAGERQVLELGERSAAWLQSRYATWILAAISFVESVFAPILIDPFLIALIFARRERWLVYVTISVVFSVAGGVFGYFLGLWFFETAGLPLLTWLGLLSAFDWIARELSANGFAFVLLGAVTPIPYKVVAIASGVVEVSFWTFFFASVFGRIIRLGLVGYAAYAVGPRALPLIRKHLLTLAYILGVILILYIAFQILF